MEPKFIPVAFSITPEQNRWIESEAIARAQGTMLTVNKSVVAREAIELLRAKREGLLNQLILDELVKSKENRNVQETQHS